MVTTATQSLNNMLLIAMIIGFLKSL